MAKAPTPVAASEEEVSGTVIVDNTDAAHPHAVEAEKVEVELDKGTVQVNYI